MIGRMIDETEDKMFCKKCGTQIEAGAAFCKECGTKVENFDEVQKSTVKKMRRDYYKIGAIIASLLVFFSSLLPYCKVTNKLVIRELGFSSFSLAKQGDDFRNGIILLILTVLTVLFICLEKKVLTLMVGIMNLAAYGGTMVVFNQRLTELREELRGIMSINDLMIKGIGYYLLRVACIIFLAALLLYVFKKRELENRNS